VKGSIVKTHLALRQRPAGGAIRTAELPERIEFQAGALCCGLSLGNALGAAVEFDLSDCDGERHAVRVRPARQS
jgi:hypothetical protein